MHAKHAQLLFCQPIFTLYFTGQITTSCTINSVRALKTSTERHTYWYHRETFSFDTKLKAVVQLTESIATESIWPRKENMAFWHHARPTKKARLCPRVNSNVTVMVRCPSWYHQWLTWLLVRNEPRLTGSESSALNTEPWRILEGQKHRFKENAEIWNKNAHHILKPLSQSDQLVKNWLMCHLLLIHLSALTVTLSATKINVTCKLLYFKLTEQNNNKQTNKALLGPHYHFEEKLFSTSRYNITLDSRIQATVLFITI